MRIHVVIMSESDTKSTQCRAVDANQSGQSLLDSDCQRVDDIVDWLTVCCDDKVLKFKPQMSMICLDS